jgi:excisionase family DNA binding protein
MDMLDKALSSIQVPVPVPDVMTPEEVAGYLQVPVATLYAWRTKGTGPLAIRVGKHLRYRRADVDAWLEERATGQTSPRGAA